MNAPTGLMIEGEQRERLRERLRALGFDEVRFAAVADEAGGGLRDWPAEGMHADMAWMERTVDKRSRADLVLPGVRSVIILGVNYWQGSEAEARQLSRATQAARRDAVLHRLPMAAQGPTGAARRASRGGAGAAGRPGGPRRRALGRGSR